MTILLTGQQQEYILPDVPISPAVAGLAFSPGAGVTEGGAQAGGKLLASVGTSGTVWT